MKILKLLILLSSVLFANETIKEEPILEKWSLIGKGYLKSDSIKNQVLLSEDLGSKGVMLVSPKAYKKNITVKYKIKPLSFESVAVLMLATTNLNDNNLSFPKDYDGKMPYLVKNTNSYFMAFHNKAHKKTPFIRKYPQKLPGREALIEAKQNIMDVKWHEIEAGKHDDKIYLKIDSKTILETKDDKVLKEGHIILRIRGTKEKTASILIKDFTVKSYN